MVARTRIGVLLLGVLAVWFAITAPAAHAEGRVADHASTVTIEKDGALRVRTTITLGQAAPATLTQRVRLREDAMDQSEYVYTLSDASITAGGKQGEVRTDKDAATFTVPTSGAQEVVITYRVTGAAHKTTGDTTTVRWNTLQGLGSQADVVSAELEIPGQFVDFKCVAGPPGTEQSCAMADGAPHEGQPTITDGPRGEGEVVGVRMAFPQTVVAPNENVDERWTVGRAFSASPLPLGIALGLLVLGGLALWMMHRRAGRDAAPGSEHNEVARFEHVDGATVFKVGDSVKPGEVGTVADERVDPIDVTATIIDLAVRGHVLIVELPRTSEFAPTDWTFRRTGSVDTADLRPYEAELLDAVAPEDGSEVYVSQIGPAVSAHIPSVQNKLYDEMVEQGWYERRPDATRTSWMTAAWIGLILSIVVTGVLAAFTSFGLVGLALVLLALGLAFVAQEMPARTPKGAQLLAALGGLRSDLLSQPTDQMPKEHAYRELSQVLPYAIVLGGVDRWLAALVDADDDDEADPTDLFWYNGPDTWHMRHLPDSLRNFVTTVSGNLFAR